MFAADSLTKNNALVDASLHALTLSLSLALAHTFSVFHALSLSLSALSLQMQAPSFLQPFISHQRKP